MVHIVLYSDGLGGVSVGLGGAEKRFIGMWLHLQKTGRRHVGLVVGEALRAKLGTVREFAGIEAFDDRITTFAPGHGPGGLRSVLFRLWRADRRSVFHYVHIPPFILQTFPSRRNVFSMTASSWEHTSVRGLLATYIGMTAAGHIDVLNEPVWAPLRRQLFWRRDSITLTPSSFVDLDVYEPAPFEEKKNRLTFVGLFSREKNAPRLVEALPRLDALLRAEGIVAEYRLLGRNAETPGVIEACAKLREERGIDVEAYEETDPQPVLAGSKVFFSLQRTTNYPSKSLQEGIACGALPIVTDVADSRRIAPDAIAFWVPRDFTADDIAPHALRILRMPKDEFMARVAAGREHLRAHFSVETMAAYFLDIYARLGAPVERTQAA